MVLIIKSSIVIEAMLFYYKPILRKLLFDLIFDLHYPNNFRFKPLYQYQSKNYQVQYFNLRMSFLNLDDLTAVVEDHQQFKHEIKGKRIKKQLSTLKEYHNDKLTFKKFELSSSGISFLVQTQHQYRLFDFEILIDFQYPFNRPKVYYQHQSSQFSNCLDLLDTILDGNNWGPSMLISSILDRINNLAIYLSQENQAIIATYHIGDIYEEDLLVKYKVQLFNVDEYEWKYMIKSTNKKVLGFTKETLLKFAFENGKLKLEHSIRITHLKQANATINAGKFKLDIVSNNESGSKKLYFGGDEADIEKILYFMNPIQVVERRLTKSEKLNYSAEELKDVIQKYSELIEHYSLRDQQKTRKYINIVQQLIKKSYQHDLKQDNLEIAQKQDIKT